MVEAWGGRVPLSQLVLWENILRLRERGYWGKLLQLLLYRDRRVKIKLMIG